MSQTQPTITNANAPRFEDRILHCKDCREPFIFSVGEQRFYAANKLVHDPVRCRECRRKNKLRRAR